MHRVRGHSDYSDRMRCFSQKGQAEYLRESQEALVDDQKDKRFELAQRRYVDRYSNFWKELDGKKEE